jgi:hypothetical protein
MKTVNFKSFSVYQYKKSCIVISNQTEMFINKDILQESSILGGRLLKGAKIDQFESDNKDHKVIWIKDQSKRKTQKPVFWALMFPGYKKPVIEDWVKKLRNPNFKIADLHKTTTEMQAKVKDLAEKYEKPERKKPAKKAEKQDVNALLEQMMNNPELLKAFQAMTAKK